MTRVIHTGDTHIGYRQYHSTRRRQDFIDAFECVVTDAIADDVDAVVHAGDLFHDSRPELSDIVETVSILRKLASHSIPFLGVVGNHESTRNRQWLDLFEDIGLAIRLDASGTVVGDVTFYGLDYVPVSRRDQLSYQFATPSTESTALVSHGLFEPFAHADWETEAVLAESTVDFDVLLLGDNHVPDRAQVSDTWVTYCGSTERASATEREQRGYNVVTFDGEVRIARRQIAETRDFVFIDLDLQSGQGTQFVIDEVTSFDLTDAVTIVTISGDGDDVIPARVEEAAKANGALIVRLTDSREHEDEAVPRARFSDPDAAVDDRISELPLTGAGLLIDDIVRDDSIPESSVRRRTRSRIETLLEELPSEFDRHRSEQRISPSTEATTKASDSTDDSDIPDTPSQQQSESGQTSIGEF